MTNSGKAFEAMISDLFRTMEIRKLAFMRKTDPPVKVMGAGANRRVIFLENPFLDYIGTIFSERRTVNWVPIAVECKSTSVHTLPMGLETKLTKKQIDNMRIMGDHGIGCFLFWSYDYRYRLFTRPFILKMYDSGAKSLKFEDGEPFNFNNPFEGYI